MIKETICNIDECTGCGLCVALCPRKAIDMTYNKEGFIYPNVNSDLCANCGICEKNCIVNRGPKYISTIYECYAAWTNEYADRKQGSSGGVFSVLAKWILSQGGIVIGAAFDTDLNLKHICVSSQNELPQLYGSKYIQSYTVDIYPKIKEFLAKNLKVLFVGTPCQIDALYSFCDDDCENLYTCDLVCYGVSSTSYFVNCMEELKKKYKSETLNIYFRKKTYGCHNSSFHVDFKNGKAYDRILYISPFGLPFSSKYSNRKSCFCCKYCAFPRMGDLTLGDYPKNDLEMHNISDIVDGISFLRVNTEKGVKVFDAVSDSLTIQKLDIDDAMKYTVRQKPQNLNHEMRDKFFLDYTNYGYDFIQKKYCKTKIKEVFKLRFNKQELIMKKTIKRLLKKA